MKKLKERSAVRNCFTRRLVENITQTNKSYVTTATFKTDQLVLFAKEIMLG